MPYSQRFASRTPFRSHRYSAATHIQSVVRRRVARKNLKNLKLNPTVGKLVQRKINKNVEQKTANKFGSRVQLVNLPALSSRVRNLMPQIVPGTSHNERVGTAIKARNLNIKGCLTIPADDNVYAPLSNGDRADIQLRLMCMSSKLYNSVDVLRQNWEVGSGTEEYTKIFKVSANAEAPTGRLTDMWKQINTESFTVHYDKVFVMKRGVGYFPDITSTSGAAHMPAINKPFNINVKCKSKKIKYTDPSHVKPNNFAPFLLATWAYTNGAPASALSAVPFWETYVTLNYYDA